MPANNKTNKKDNIAIILALLLEDAGLDPETDDLETALFIVEA